MTRPPASGPVTAVISWEVTAGREAEFEHQIDRVNARSSRSPGFEGAALLRPDRDDHRYHAILTFRDATTLDLWSDSGGRADMVERLTGIAREVDRRLTTAGLEVSSGLPRRSVGSPARWKMALVTGSAVYLLVPLVQYVVGSRVADWPVPLQMAVPAVLLTLLLSYVVLPILGKLIGSWLYGDSGDVGDVVASGRGAR